MATHHRGTGDLGRRAGQSRDVSVRVGVLDDRAADLRDNGALTEHEFDGQKQRLLGGR
jgi:hypothetical protein